MTLADLRILLEEIEEAIDPYVDREDQEAVRAAARAAVEVLKDAGVIELEGFGKE